MERALGDLEPRLTSPTCSHPGSVTTGEGQQVHPVSTCTYPEHPHLTAGNRK